MFTYMYEGAEICHYKYVFLSSVSYWFWWIHFFQNMWLREGRNKPVSAKQYQIGNYIFLKMTFVAISLICTEIAIGIEKRVKTFGKKKLWVARACVVCDLKKRSIIWGFIAFIGAIIGTERQLVRWHRNIDLFRTNWVFTIWEVSTARFLSTVNLVSGLGEYKDKYKDARSTVTYEVKGDNWKIKYVTSLYPDKPMEYDVTAGKEFDGKGPDGSDVKVICENFYSFLYTFEKGINLHSCL